MRRFVGPSSKTRRQIPLHLVLILICLAVMLPIATTVLISFKREEDTVRRPPIIFPCNTATSSFDLSACRWAVEGYQRVLAPKPSSTSLLGFILTGNMLRLYIPNSLLYASASALLVTLLAALSGYALSRFRFTGHRLLMISFLIIMGVPWLTELLALYQMRVTMAKTLPFYNDRVFIVFVYTGFWLPLSVWIAKGFFDAIPRELEEAALIDGCSPLGALARILAPLSAPGLAAIFLYTFVAVWNEFIAGYLLIGKNAQKPVMFGLYDFLGQSTISLQVVAAACILIALPVIILFLFTRRSFFKAMVEGAVKG
jgi:multiple sugar transport system permease protein